MKDTGTSYTRSELLGNDRKHGRTIKDWLYLNFSRAQNDARRIIEQRSDKYEYLMYGRFDNVDRNINRTVGEIEGVYELRPSNWIPHTAARHLNNGVDMLFMPAFAYNALVSELISSASAQYYYMHEKQYD